MINIKTITLNEYLKSNNIRVNNQYFRVNKNVSEKSILKQIDLIKNIDDILSGYSSIAYTRIYSNIGKKVENFKVQIKKLQVDLEERENKKDINVMDKFILNNGAVILKQANDAISSLKMINYIDIIKRSMNRNEICLGRTDESNLRKIINIDIGKLNNISYNLIEEEVYDYLKKLRRRNKEIKMEYYIDKFTYINKLSMDSKDYIKILLNIPSDSLKQWQRYKNGKKNYLPEEFLASINKALNYEVK